MIESITLVHKSLNYVEDFLGESIILTFNLYGRDSKQTDVAEILFSAVMKPCVKLQRKETSNFTSRF